MSNSDSNFGLPVQSKEGIIRGGDVEVLSVLLYSSQNKDPYDLTNIWLNISIFENIEKNYIEGQITITEAQDLFASIPIIANEKIVIEFITPSANEPYKFIGQVTEVPVRYQISQSTQTYVLGFISPEFVKNQKIQFSKSYNQTLISDMVRKIYDKFIKEVSGKELSVIPTLYTTSRVIPMMSPFKAINWMCKWAVSPAYRSGASYVFFEGRHGYYFGPVERLIDETVNSRPAAVYKRNLVNVEIGGFHDITGGFYTISDMMEEMPSDREGRLGGRDYLKNVVNGMYASKTKTHDIVLREITESTYNYFRTYPELAHLEASTKYAIYTGDTMIHNDSRLGGHSDSFVQNIPEHYLAHSNQLSSRTSSTALVRNSQFQQFFAIRLKIEVPGDSDRTVGEVVELRIPPSSPNLLGTTDETDKYLSGRYLITALRHSISRSSESNRESYVLSMEISKDSYKTPLPQQTTYHTWSE